jgi:hypothetical protein
MMGHILLYIDTTRQAYKNSVFDEQIVPAISSILPRESKSVPNVHAKEYIDAEDIAPVCIPPCFQMLAPQ